jgi:hypothetical protein
MNHNEQICYDTHLPYDSSWGFNFPSLRSVGCRELMCRGVDFMDASWNQQWPLSLETANSALMLPHTNQQRVAIIQLYKALHNSTLHPLNRACNSFCYSLNNPWKCIIKFSVVHFQLWNNVPESYLQKQHTFTTGTPHRCHAVGDVFVFFGLNVVAKLLRLQE